MKTTFRRFLIPAVAVLFCALLLLGLVFQFLVRDYLQDQGYQTVETTANTVSRLATAYLVEDSISSSEFFINLTVASQVTGAKTAICDSQGKLVVCSDSPFGCVHQGMSVEKEYLNQVFRQGSVRSMGVLQGLYTDIRFVVSVPVYNKAGQAMGIVISSIPAEDTLAMMRRLSNTCLIVSVFAVVVSVGLMSFFARRQSAPLQEMAKVATRFGHGELSSRVQVDQRSPTEVQELALAFNNMADSLEKSENRRQEFVANISHELKTPMTTISGFMDGMLDGTIPPERQTHYMQLVSEETKRLSRLVRSMLDIVQLQEQGGVSEERKTTFDMTECVGRSLLSFEQKITEKRLQVQVDMPEHPVYTHADADAISQVVYNLLDNAVKFCPEEGVLQVRLQEGKNKIYVGISNSGQTIPPEELPLVFERFHKTDKSRGAKDGWGLGLYIVKTIIGSHGENISVSSAGGNTEFTFTLPLEN